MEAGRKENVGKLVNDSAEKKFFSIQRWEQQIQGSFHWFFPGPDKRKKKGIEKEDVSSPNLSFSVMKRSANPPCQLNCPFRPIVSAFSSTFILFKGRLVSLFLQICRGSAPMQSSDFFFAGLLVFLLSLSLRNLISFLRFFPPYKKSVLRCVA